MNVAIEQGEIQIIASATRDEIHKHRLGVGNKNTTHLDAMVVFLRRRCSDIVDAKKQTRNDVADDESRRRRYRV